MERTVSIRINSTSNLRVSNVKEQEVFYIPGTFSVPTPQGVKEFQITDEMGTAQPYIIRGQANFNLDDPREKRNFENIKLFCTAYKGFISKNIEFDDPFKEAEEQQRVAERTMLVLTHLQSKKTDSEWLSKVFRRVTGLTAQGVTQTVAFTKLFEIAKGSPNAFFLPSGKPIWEDIDFEIKALVDLAIERGKLLRDGRMIKQIDGKVIAKDYDEAVFAVTSDPELRRFVTLSLNEQSQPIAVPVSTQAVNLDDDALAIAMANGVDAGNQPTFAEDNSVIKQEVIGDDKIRLAINELVNQGLIQHNGGQGAGRKYRLSEMPDNQWHPIKELVSYFKVNTKEFERYQNMLS